MKIMSTASILISVIYMMSSHPVLLMTLILGQTAMLCVAGWVKLKVSWFSYILFLIFLGGLMVLFIYIVSLASNEKIYISPEKMTMFLPIMTLGFFVYLTNFNFQQMTTAYEEATNMHINSMYSLNSFLLIFSTMVYLLLTLVIVVKVSNKFEAPLKNLIFK